jgi:hypothetical protein
VGDYAAVTHHSTPATHHDTIGLPTFITITMSVLVVGSVALDSVETPFGKAEGVIGGSGTFFSASASHLAPVQLVGVVGDD